MDLPWACVVIALCLGTLELTPPTKTTVAMTMMTVIDIRPYSLSQWLRIASGHTSFRDLGGASASDVRRFQRIRRMLPETSSRKAMCSNAAVYKGRAGDKQSWNPSTQVPRRMVTC